MARQLILDNAQCDFIIFLDADDILMPRAVELLYSSAKKGNYDIVISNFIKEDKKKDVLMTIENNIITWFHGKIYKMSFIKNNNLKFLPDVRTNEDAYFNAVALKITEN